MADQPKPAPQPQPKHGGGTPAKSGPNKDTGKHVGKDADKGKGSGKK